jgi:hypothetical protein
MIAQVDASPRAAALQLEQVNRTLASLIGEPGPEPGPSILRR